MGKACQDLSTTRLDGLPEWARAAAPQTDPRVLAGRFLNDKVGHFLLYAVLGVVLAWAGRHNSGFRIRAVAAALLEQSPGPETVTL